MDKRNNAIDIFRFFAAIMVVMIHMHPFKGINYNIDFFFSDVVARIAVPYFFAVSGYFYYKGIEKSKHRYRYLYNQLKKLLNKYFIWSVVYFSIELINYLINNYSMKDFIISRFLLFFIEGSYYHLWFFPALCFAMIITTVLFNYKKKLFFCTIILYFVGVICCSYYNLLSIDFFTILQNIASNQYFVIIRRILLMGLPFFTLGGYIALKNKVEEKKSIIMLIISSICFLLEIILVITYKWQLNIILTFWLYPLIYYIINFLLGKPMEKYNKLGAFSKFSSEIIYYSHPLFIILLENICGFEPCLAFFLLIMIELFINGMLFMKN